MTAHVLVPSLDESRPATLSRPIVTGLLRDELRFEGIIVSDDLEMRALASERAVPDSAVLAAGETAAFIDAAKTRQWAREPGVRTLA